MRAMDELTIADLLGRRTEVKLGRRAARSYVCINKLHIFTKKRQTHQKSTVESFTSLSLNGIMRGPTFSRVGPPRCLAFLSRIGRSDLVIVVVISVVVNRSVRVHISE